MGDVCNVIRFPVEQEMPRHVAQQKIGRAKRYKYPSVDVIGLDTVESWTEKFLIGKSVICGWTPINIGLPEAFKSKRVRHIISLVDIQSLSIRPSIEICCMGHDLYQVYNWVISSPLRMMKPVTLLNADQSVFFRRCKKCEEYLDRIMNAKADY